MSEDPEIVAMGAIASALSPLESDAALRVLVWANTRFGDPGLGRPHAPTKPPAAPAPAAGVHDPHATDTTYRDLADLMEAAAPKTGNARVLVACHWFNVHEGQEALASAQVHDELKHLGYPMANITKAFTDLSKAKPALVQQLRKSGTSQQARKQYRITRAGMSEVQQMIRETTEA